MRAASSGGIGVSSTTRPSASPVSVRAPSCAVNS
jgi:hypothetical protein